MRRTRLDARVPFIEAADGTRIHYRDAGHGSPIVFVHGWMMSGDFFHRQTEGLSASHRVIAPDLRGCGDSETRPGTHDLDHFADDIHTLITKLELGRITLVGWSMGGGITMRYIDRHGDASLAAVGLVDFPPHFEEDPSVPAKVAARLRTDRDAFIAGFFKRMFLAPLPPHELARLGAENAKCASETGIEMYGELGAGDARGNIQRTPSFLAFPTQGWYHRALESWKGIFPQHVAPLFEKSRHCPFLEEADLFNRELSKFVDTHQARRE